ncbi:MAG: hypothetical protein ACP5OZ_02455 [Candidatus Woesearchaeota archaeon]
MAEQNNKNGVPKEDTKKLEFDKDLENRIMASLKPYITLEQEVKKILESDQIPKTGDLTSIAGKIYQKVGYLVLNYYLPNTFKESDFEIDPAKNMLKNPGINNILTEFRLDFISIKKALSDAGGLTTDFITQFSREVANNFFNVMLKTHSLDLMTMLENKNNEKKARDYFTNYLTKLKEDYPNLFKDRIVDSQEVDNLSKEELHGYLFNAITGDIIDKISMEKQRLERKKPELNRFYKKV